MATVSARASLADFVDLENHAVWAEKFSPSIRSEQLADDLSAGHCVTGILFAVVCMGMLLMAVTVWLCL
jgi:hypothetical protein